MDELRDYILRRMGLNSGGFSAAESEALIKAFEALIDELEDIDARVGDLEDPPQ